MADLRKAAIILMSLPAEEAGLLLSRLDSKQVEQVSIEIARLKAVPADEQEDTILEFSECNPSRMGSELGGMDVAKRMVEQALGPNAAGTINNIRQSIEAMPFGFLQNVDCQNISTYIADEHPQTIALILSYLPPSFGAEILASFATEKQLSIVRRIATMGQTNPEIIQEVEKGLEGRMASVMRQNFQNAGGVEAVAEMLNVSDRATERTLLENLGQEDPDLVEDIRRLMFVFEDISTFSDKDIQSILKNVESAQWAMSLKGASESLKKKVLGNMSERAGAMLREEMDYLGAVKLTAVEQMQQEIVDIIRRLEDAGEIELNKTDAEEELVS